MKKIPVLGVSTGNRKNISIWEMAKQPELSEFYSDAEISHLADIASRAEELGTLADSQIELLVQKKFHKLFIPKQYNGLEKNLPDALSILEKTSYLDGSLGWSLTLIAGAGFLGAFMNPEFADQFFTNNNAIITGSGFPGGKAELQGSSYSVNGKWKYATGIEHATLITATCFITENSKIKNKDGEAVTKAFAFYPDEITVHKTWNSYGLKATGSHNFEVRNIHIPKRRMFTISPEESHFDTPLYRYPFDAFAHATLAVSLLGMANRFLDEAEHILHSRNDVTTNTALPEPQNRVLKEVGRKLNQARGKLYQAVNTSWNNLQTNGPLHPKTVNNVCKQSRKACQQAINSVQNIYPFLGMTAINLDTVINRCWRDIHTASQHMFLRPQKHDGIKIKKGDLQ